MKRYVLFIFSLLTALVVNATVGVTASIDSTAIYIGEQAHITLKIAVDADQKITFPVFPEKILTPGIEVIKEKVVASESLNDGKQISATKVYTITSFDTAAYYIPPFEVKVAGKIYESKNLALKVEPVEIDTLHLDKFFGPKENAPVPFSWDDWRGLFWLSLLLIICLSILGYMALQLHNKRPMFKKFRIKPILPPHQWAIKEIDKINKEKDVKEDTKTYYTRLTDVLRSYIQQRFGFNAREMTSTEIIEHLTQQDDKTSLSELQDLFQTADLAKFAKLQTELNENDKDLLRAIDFIQATKVETVVEVKPKQIVPPEIKRTTRTRLVIKLVMGLLSGLSIALLVLICKSIYYLFF